MIIRENTFLGENFILKINERYGAKHQKRSLVTFLFALGLFFERPVLDPLDDFS
jgi:hypothetical protein